VTDAEKKEEALTPEPAEEANETAELTHEGLDSAEEPERTGLSGVAASIADAAAPVISVVDSLTSGARRMIGDRGGARVRRVRRMAREPLANLWELHPEARRASIRELGFQGVPVGRIAGTAVEGSPQRGGDFLPLRDRRSDDWRSRWQRILSAIESLVPLPPVELIKFGDEYWVVDGHNRVAGALYTGQDEIDAVVQELRLPGMPAERPVPIAGVLEGSLDLRDAGAGRYTRTTTRPVDRLSRQTTDEYSDDDE
jgi:hypothetical protein